MLKMDEVKQYRDNGTFERVASLFSEISDLCKEIENNSLTSGINFENLGK
jgi:hypothetical protein